MLAAASTPVQKVLRECNWMQALEGDIDTVHLGFLHLGAVKPEDTDARQLRLLQRRPTARRATTSSTRDFGTSYGAYRPAEDDTYYWRIAHFLFPFYTMIPTGTLGDVRSSCAPGCRSTTSTRCSGAWACRARARAGTRGRRGRR